MLLIQVKNTSNLKINQEQEESNKVRTTEAELPIVPTRTISDFVQEFIGVKKPDKVKVKNPTGNVLRNGASEVVVPGGSDHVDGGLRDGASGSVSV
ncbi:hypothetical protein Tco_0551606 [Tanacetum coccineum]